MADIMAIATIKENAMMNIFRNGFLVRKFMMVAMMTAMAVNITATLTTMAKRASNSPIFGVSLKVSKDNNVKRIENVMIYVLRNRFL